jgi:hypothetical protein
MDMMGDELDSYELEGDDVLGDDVLGMSLVGRAAPARRALGKPRWRRRMAPGVPMPDYGVFPVPLTPASANGTFALATANIEYRAITQVPFRGERLLTRVTRSGAAASQVFAQNGIFVGIRPQIGVLGALNLENYAANSFGVRMVMQPAEQGAELRAFCFVNPVVGGTDTLTLSIEILGRVAR